MNEKRSVQIVHERRVKLFNTNDQSSRPSTNLECLGVISPTQKNSYKNKDERDLWAPIFLIFSHRSEKTEN